LSGKPGNVREYYRCQGNVRDFSKIQGIVMKKHLIGINCPKTLLKIASTGFLVLLT